MNFWIISDTHFGHDKLKEYTHRPDGFEQTIIKNTLKVCRPGDVLIHLGDICIGSDEEWHDCFSWHIASKLWLIRGNHDSKSITWYLSHGWDFVADEITIDAFGKRICFSHEPISSNKSDGGTRFDINIHGHCHADNHRREDNGLDYQYLIAMEHDYKPVSLRAIIENKFYRKGK